MLLRADRLFTGHATHSPGVIEIAGDRVVRAGPVTAAGGSIGAERVTGGGAPIGAEPAIGGEPVIDLGAATIAPGFVDVHCHGGGGATVDSDLGVVIACHLAQGTTSLVASLVTQSLATLRTQVAHLAPLVTSGDLAGIHLEGPWLAEQHRGAHQADLLRVPDPAEILSVLDAGAGAIRMVTIAPELRGGLAAVRLLADRGVVAAIGHTAATFLETRAAITAGATGATHLFNAMPPLLHRAPGPVLALLGAEGVFLELIVDGVHVDPAVVAWIAHQHPQRVVFVTDAMAAAGSADGVYTLGTKQVEVHAGIARVAGTQTLAGSTLTLSRAVRTAIGAGVPWETALRAATVTPAHYLRLPGVGELGPGSAADLVVLDTQWHVTGVMRHGRWI